MHRDGPLKTLISSPIYLLQALGHRWCFSPQTSLKTAPPAHLVQVAGCSTLSQSAPHTRKAGLETAQYSRGGCVGKI